MHAVDFIQLICSVLKEIDARFYLGFTEVHFIFTVVFALLFAVMTRVNTLLMTQFVFLPGHRKASLRFYGAR